LASPKLLAFALGALRRYGTRKRLQILEYEDPVANPSPLENAVRQSRREQ
jgi:hypothetical protein